MQIQLTGSYKTSHLRPIPFPSCIFEIEIKKLTQNKSYSIANSSRSIFSSNILSSLFNSETHTWLDLLYLLLWGVYSIYRLNFATLCHTTAAVCRWRFPTDICSSLFIYRLPHGFLNRRFRPSQGSCYTASRLSSSEVEKHLLIWS